MAILNSIISKFNSSRLSQIDRFIQSPADVQHKQLFKLLAQAKHTYFGEKYSYKTINNITDFQNRVPILDYEEIEPYIDRVRKGENKILWSEKIKWYAKSSGTTSSKSKYIPISKSSLEECHYRGGKDVLAIYHNLYPDNNILKGKGLTLGGSQKLSKHNSHAFDGDLSAILIGNLPYWVNFIRTPSQSIALLEKWEEKLEKITAVTIKENITSISGVPSWFLVLIKHILNVTGKDNLLELWPNLELFIHGGINFAPYREQYKQLIPSDNMHYLETYNASEGFFAIQNDPSTNDMLLMLDYGIFYEFIPMDELDKEHPKALTIDDVELNTNYAIVISTNGGLWRYKIGDTVKFTSKYPHKIVITGRIKHFINAFGEEIIIDNSDRAIKVACEETNARIKEYSAAPQYMSAEKKGRHEWIVEFEKEPDNFETFCTILDKELQNVNSDYEAKRYNDITLDKPLIHKGRKNLFYDWLQMKGKLGGQNKVPRLSNNRELIEELLKLNKQNM